MEFKTNRDRELNKVEVMKSSTGEIENFCQIFWS